MPCVVFLRDSQETIIVKKAWCQCNNGADIINCGTRPGELVKIFYSPNKREKPNFGLENRWDFNGTVAACYFGFILDNFGKQNRPKGIICIRNFLHQINYVFVFCVFILDSYRAAESCAERKSRLRCLIPIDYDEREKKVKKRIRPKTEYSKVIEKISNTIENMSALKKEIYIQNRIKDKISVDDLSEIEDLLDDSDSDSEETIDIIEADSTHADGQSSSTSAIENLKVDTEFSLEYSFTTDVGGF